MLRALPSNRRTVLQMSVAAAGLALSQGKANAGCPTMRSAGPRPSEDIAQFLEAKISEHKLPGAGLAYVESARLAWEAGFGATNIATQAKVTPHTLFQAASLTKPLFAYVVHQAIDLGELSLDDRLVDYVRPADLSPNPWNDEVTVRDALQHTTGLPNWRDHGDWIKPLDPSYQPGTDSSYSGEAFHWLQQVMERITGKGVDALMRDRLFEPGRLDDMQMHWSADRDAREVYSHELNETGDLVVRDLQYIREIGWRFHEVSERWGKPLNQWTTWDHAKAVSEMRPHTHKRLSGNPSWVWSVAGRSIIDSASSLRCTPGDYARFVCLMMPGRPREAWQVEEKTRQLMLAPQYERPTVQNGVLPRGLGWGLEKRSEGIVFYHWGKNGRSHHALALGDVAKRRGIVVMTHGTNGKAFIRDVVTGLMDQSYIGVVT